MNKKKYTSFAVYIAIIAAFILVVLYFGQILGLLKVIVGIARPIIIGTVLAFVLNIIMIRLEKIYWPHSKKKIVKASRRPICILLSFIIIAAIIALVLALVIPAVIEAVKLLADNVAILFERLRDLIIDNKEQFPTIAQKIADVDVDWASLGDKMWSFLKGGIGAVFGSTFSIISGTFGAIIDVLMGVIFSIYVLASKEKLKRQCGLVIKHYWNRYFDKINYVYRTAYGKFSAFVIGQFTEAIILGSLCCIGMLILRLPYAPVVGVLIGFTALIPIAGAYIGAVVGALLILTVSPIKALIFIIFLVILQQIEGNLIYPKVVGTSIGLPGIWVFVAVIIGGGIAGIPGMLLGVPIMATIYVLVKNKVSVKKAPKKVEKDEKSE